MNPRPAPIALPAPIGKTQIMKHSLSIIAVATLALTLASCAGSPSAAPGSSPAPTAQSTTADAPSSVTGATELPMEHGPVALTGNEFAFAIGNTFGKFTLPGEPDPELSRLMKKVDDSDPITFATVTVDNRGGHDEAFINSIRIYDAAGAEYVFARAIDVVEVLHEELPDSVMDYDKYIELFELHSGSAAKGQVAEFVMVSGEKLPESFARITVDAGGLVGEGDVVTLAEAEAQGMPIDFEAPKK